MKLKYLSSVLLLLILSSCDLIGELQEDHYEYISRSQIYIDKITLFTETENFVQYLGKPDSTSSLHYYYEGLDIFVQPSDSLIWEINCTNPKYSTPDGIKVGDSIEKVLDAYGETKKYGEHGIEELHYRNDSFSIFQRPPLYLIFHTKDKKVAKIQLWWHYE